MVRKTFEFALIIAQLGVTMVTEAQVGGFLKDKAQKAVVKSLKRGEDEKKVEEQHQEVRPEKEEIKQPSAADRYMQQKMMGLMGFKNVKFDPAYSFS